MRGFAMLSRFPRWLPLAATALLLGGCLHWGAEPIDPIICDMGTKPMDLEPAPPVNLQMPRTEEPSKTGALSPDIESLALQPVDAREPLASGLAQEKPETPPPEKGPPPLYIPPRFPGGAESFIKVAKADASAEEKAAAVRRLFPPLEPIGPDIEPEPGPNGNPLTLADFQRLAVTNSPLIKQALADVRAAEGAALQAGLHPNPIFGYVSDSVNSGATAGLQGVFLEQRIIGWGKLDLARGIATIDVRNAQLAVRAARNSVAKAVRNAYFAVLVAVESVKVNGAVYEFADKLYESQLDLAVRGLGAPYEPMQLRLLVVQARTSLAASRNAYLTAWKQLASAIGLPGMKPTLLAGRVDTPLPIYRHADVLAHVLTRHTDVLTARNAVLRAQTALRLAQVTPLPDPDVQVKLEKDYTVAPFLLTNSLQITIPVAIWDRNQGGIMLAEGQLIRAEEEDHRVRSDLTARLADAFGRYESNRYILEQFRTETLPYQIKAYRAMYDRWHREKPGALALSATPTFQDLFNNQVFMATNIGNYLSTLAATWAAVMDVADLLQTEDLFGVMETQEVCPVPSLNHLPPLPCHHPCSPLPDPALKGADGQWPAAAPRKEDRTMPPADTSEQKKQASTPATTTEPQATPTDRPVTPMADFVSKPRISSHLPPRQVDAQLLDEPPPMPKLPERPPGA
jgi:cobalt-zinc-cadmium efflux system outer membrane protein